MHAKCRAVTFSIYTNYNNLNAHPNKNKRKCIEAKSLGPKIGSIRETLKSTSGPIGQRAARVNSKPITALAGRPSTYTLRYRVAASGK